ncbi:MAG: cobyric acid synthase [Methanomassiliicoccaceae archaeon]|nr:cobyric acid synthase [Methanomassiliicoccaceae archaeon]
MDCLKAVKAEIERGHIGPNPKCKHYPCHYAGQDCTYCFCPFHPCRDKGLGEFIQGSNNKKCWSCKFCHFIHRVPVAKYIDSRIKELNITEPTDPRISELFDEVRERFKTPGKAIMVLGATSDAGKSITAAALCRIISKKGHSVTPLKTQNMSLSSMITDDGSEIASIQMIQAKASRLKHPDHNINPILIKPMRDGRTEVILNGKRFGDFDVDSYYKKFVPSEGTEAVKKSIRALKKRCEFVVMEGAGSPAEINIYDYDIANMRAAEIADAYCILVVNMNWGGAFAYALGTVELLKPDDRKRLKGIIFNNMHGDPSSLTSGIKELESITGIPVLGVIPHMDMSLPAEDSLTLRSSDPEEEKIKVCVVKLPKIVGLTDMDPMYHENVSIRYTDDPKDIREADMIVIPGTKDSIVSMKWMRSAGIEDAIKKMKGKVPIVGISGGYQIMGSSLLDDLAIEGEVSSKTEGMGLFNAVTSWKKNGGAKAHVKGVIVAAGGDVRGYEMHTGDTVTKEKPLFALSTANGLVDEGSSRAEDKLFGTYVHGLFDEPAFRKYVLSLTGKYTPSKYSNVSYGVILNETFDTMADIFERSLDMDLFEKVFMGCRQ